MSKGSWIVRERSGIGGVVDLITGLGRMRRKVWVADEGDFEQAVVAEQETARLGKLNGLEGNEIEAQG
jgi:hypothetical protein